jgi:predicted esterase
VLGARKAAYAFDNLLAVMVDMAAEEKRTDGAGMSAYADAAKPLAELGDPRAIPAMIGVIEADDSNATIYGVGNFGLEKLTGVKYDDSHNGAWWRRWWSQNRERFPEPARGMEIPAFAKKRGAAAGEKHAAPRAEASIILSQSLAAGGDPMMRYELIGPRGVAAPSGPSAAPEGGWKLLLVLAGGDGSAEFKPFVTSICEEAAPEGFIVAQLIAPSWGSGQFDTVVWPTAKLRWEGARFTTEEFIGAVVRDVSARYQVNARQVYALGWSSGGPPVYAALCAEGSPLAGAMVAMSVFKPESMPVLKGAAGKRVYVLHSATDFIQMRFPEAARDQLAAAGATTKLETYEGGHGWHGDVHGNIRRGIEWLVGR